jgi:hypothetical protein
MNKTIKPAVLAVIVATGAYWYWSPYVAVRQLKSAAENGDADTFNEHVDYPKLRESLKGQLAAFMADQMASNTSSGDSAGAAGAALGSMLGMALMDRMVEAFMRPEVVMRAMQEGKLKPSADSGKQAPTSSKQEKVDWSFERKGVDKLIAYGSQASEPANKRVGIVFERTGFVNWKLTEIRLPSAR